MCLKASDYNRTIRHLYRTNRLRMVSSQHALACYRKRFKLNFIKQRHLYRTVSACYHTNIHRLVNYGGRVKDASQFHKKGQFNKIGQNYETIAIFDDSLFCCQHQLFWGQGQPQMAASMNSSLIFFMFRRLPVLLLFFLAPIRWGPGSLQTAKYL